jgi:glutaredoxin 3
MYTKDHCSYCVKAKALLAREGIEYEEIDGPSNRESLIETVTQVIGTPPTTLPQIFIDGVYVGGHDDLVKWLAKR